MIIDLTDDGDNDDISKPRKDWRNSYFIVPSITGEDNSTRFQRPSPKPKPSSIRKVPKLLPRSRPMVDLTSYAYTPPRKEISPRKTEVDREVYCESDRAEELGANECTATTSAPKPKKTEEPLIKSNKHKKSVRSGHHDTLKVKTQEASIENGARLEERRPAMEVELEREEPAIFGSSVNDSKRCPCPICDATFSCRDTVKSHFKNCVLKNGNPEGKTWDGHESCWPKNRLIPAVVSCRAGVPDGRPFRCLFCDGAFLRQDHFRSHSEKCARKNQKSKHKDTTPYRRGTDVSSEKALALSKKRSEDLKALNLGQSILKPNLKRTFQDNPLDALVTPSEVASKKGYVEHTEIKRRKLELQRLEEFRTEKVPEDLMEGFGDWNARGNPAATEIARSEPFTPPQTINGSYASDESTQEEPILSDISVPHDAVSRPVPHPTISGKCVPETLISGQHEAEETSEVMYVYYVSLRNWGFGLSEKKAAKKNFGPFYTVAEANFTATTEVKYPLRRLEDMTDSGLDVGLYPRTGWSYNYNQEEYGMQTHRLSAGGFHAEAAVHREIPLNPTRLSLPKSIYQISSIIYLVQRLICYRSSARAPAIDDLFEEAPNLESTSPDCEKVILGAYTVLDLANKYAGDHYVTLVTQGMKNTGVEGIRKVEIKSKIRTELQEMEKDGLGELFKRYVDIEDAPDGSTEERFGRCVVWVESVDVDGPRN
ncbi:MAG: hypothetical protein Q9217_003871 [Psora testacea]